MCDRGVQLLEREQELCILYEKLNMQERLICQTNREVQALEEEIHPFKMLINKENRLISLSKNIVPFKKALEDEFALVQKQVNRSEF